MPTYPLEGGRTQIRMLCLEKTESDAELKCFSPSNKVGITLKLEEC